MLLKHQEYHVHFHKFLSQVSLNIENLNGKYKSMAFANAKVAEKIKREEAWVNTIAVICWLVMIVKNVYFIFRDQPENYPAEDAEGVRMMTRAFGIIRHPYFSLS